MAGGVTPGKGGTPHLDLPEFDTVDAAVRSQRAMSARSRITGMRLQSGSISSLASTVMQHRVSDAQEAAQEPSGRAARYGGRRRPKAPHGLREAGRGICAWYWSRPLFDLCQSHRRHGSSGRQRLRDTCVLPLSQGGSHGLRKASRVIVG